MRMRILQPEADLCWLFVVTGVAVNRAFKIHVDRDFPLWMPDSVDYTLSRPGWGPSLVFFRTKKPESAVRGPVNSPKA